MNIVCLMWSSHISMLVRAVRGLDDVQASLFSTRTLENDPAVADRALSAMSRADAVILYRSTEPFWETMDKRLKEISAKVPVICLSFDPSFWALSSAAPEVVRACHAYLVMGGEDNYANMLRFVAAEVLGQDAGFEPPRDVPWDGLYHPDAQKPRFETLDEYLAWYGPVAEARGLGSGPWVGVVFSRHYWVNRNLAVEDACIRALEAQGLRVAALFTYGVRDESLGTRGAEAAVRDVFLRPDGPRIKALVKLQAFFLASSRHEDNAAAAGRGSRLLAELNVPVFQPVISSHLSVAEWQDSAQGLAGDIAWSVAMPEFEGVIEPLLIGAAKRFTDGETGTLVEEREPVAERCQRLAARVARWARLADKPPAERKAAFILHNSPCNGAEATVGGGANLDTLESVARVMQAMRRAGYQVTPPESGKELIETIMGRKAVSEFRWTTIDEIVRKGGVLERISLSTYLKWWQDFPAKVRKRVAETWGEPPGQEMNGVPPAMVHEGDILLTGVSYGNAVVMTQPKRGCAGPRCDGQVCKILHDPEVPPPHQYLATYRWLDKGFEADVLIHVGTHGNLEFLPGKGVGLSESCLPDLALGETPHLYIYNSDNPPEGTIAKRRSNAVLVDHMQTVMTQGGLYDDLEELDRLLAERDQAKLTDRARAHALEHMILDLAAKLNLDKEVRLKGHQGFDAAARAMHESLARIRATQIQDGMHVFGEIPQAERRVDFMRSILRFDAEDPGSLRKTLCRLMGLDLKALLAEPGAVDQRSGQSHGRLLERVETLCGQTIAETLRPGGDPKAFVRRALDLGPEAELKDLDAVRQRVLDLNDRIEASREIDSLLNGMSGGHIQAGPSGIVTRGRDDILPTGRNFYSLDPRRVPTKAAYRVGQQLAHALLEKHVKEEGRLPENVAMYWMCNDIMWSDGEGMAQIFALLGVRPKWAPDGRVSGVEVVPLEELGRPRVDVTIRVSGLIRDNFPGCMDLIDDAVRAAAEQNEPLEMNFVRRHALDDLSFDEDSGDAEEQWRRATLRLFAAKPGCYLPGVNLAVYASAWKDESDLADIFVTWNGYAYGRDVPGEARQEQLINRLKTVDVTFNKVISDEHDLFGCCCYFGSHGGMTAAARHLAGHEVRTYYGDTREPEQVEVRDLADEIRRVVRTKLLNPKWIEGMKRHGYKGAMDISKRVGRVYGWESTTQEVDDWIFDDIARTFVLDDENREFFRDNNPWALEEIGRRLLEAEGRGLWQADQEVLEGLREAYLEMEGWLEESMGEVDGDFQGGSVDVYSPAEVQAWETYMRQRKTKDTQGS